MTQPGNIRFVNVNDHVALPRGHHALGPRFCADHVHFPRGGHLPFFNYDLADPAAK